ncbi:MAG: D-tyrosyl-tRNA(Tyr) deacylase [Clostridia bacterium]|nr:D-tyrosyl-tRNA(Tyr) deacylase [Clostridia bacterium]
MRALVQRVLGSNLKIDGKEYSKIGKGIIIFLGVTHDDTKQDAIVLANKIAKLRIFEDENDKMNLCVTDVEGELHIISQFTLYADCHHGNRPSFINAAKPEVATALYETFIEECRKLNLKFATGKFGADMKINYINDGPISIMLECKGGKIL